jgi:Yip1 domain
VLQTLLDLARRPCETLARVAERAAPREGLAPVLALGALYAAFALLLHLGGHAPSVTLVPIPRERYYLWQSVFVAPLFVVLWLVYALVAHGLSRLAGGRGAAKATLAVIGLGYAAPVALLFVVPDLAVYLVAGHGALGKAMRVYAPLAVIACLGLCAAGLRAAHGLGPGRAVLAALAGFVAQGAVGGILLR